MSARTDREFAVQGCWMPPHSVGWVLKLCGRCGHLLKSDATLFVADEAGGRGIALQRQRELAQFLRPPYEKTRSMMGVDCFAASFLALAFLLEGGWKSSLQWGGGLVSALRRWRLA